MFKIRYLSNNETKKLYYKKYSNKLNKNSFQKNVLKLKENIGNPQKTWEILRTLLSQNKDPLVNIFKQIIVNENKINDPEKILAQLNEYFGAIGEKLAGKFSNNNETEFRKFLRNRISSSIYLEPYVGYVMLHLNWVFFHLVAKSPGLCLSINPERKMKCQIIAQYQY